MHLKPQMATKIPLACVCALLSGCPRVRACVCLQKRWVVANRECKVSVQVTTEGHVLKVLQKLANTDLRMQVSCVKRDARMCPVLIVLAY
jgi:hypothetical protein